MTRPNRPASGFRWRRWLVGSIIGAVLLVFLVPAGCVGFTLFCWVAKGHDPDVVLRDWKRQRRDRFVEAQGRRIMTRILEACPGELKGWDMLPYRNDLAGQYYELLNDIHLQYDYRRHDGSDDLSLIVVVNPAIGDLPWYEASPYVPDTARKLDCEGPLQAWIHEAYDWNFFLPPYDRKPGSPKACMAQVFIGDWAERPCTATELKGEELRDRQFTAREFQSQHRHPELAGPDGSIDPIGIPPEYLNPIFQTSSSRRMSPRSKPNGAEGPVYPHCIDLQVIGRDEAAVRSLLGHMDLKTLQLLTEGR